MLCSSLSTDYGPRSRTSTSDAYNDFEFPFYLIEPIELKFNYTSQLNETQRIKLTSKASIFAVILSLNSCYAYVLYIYIYQSYGTTMYLKVYEHYQKFQNRWTALCCCILYTRLIISQSVRDCTGTARQYIYSEHTSVSQSLKSNINLS